MKRAGLPIQLLVALLTITLVRGPAHAMPPELLPTVVHAGGGPRLVVVALGLDKRARSQVGLLEAAGEDAAKRTGRFELVPGVDAFDPAEARARSSREQDAAAKLKEGQKALDDLDNQKATDLFNAAQKALADTDLSRTWEQYLVSVRMTAASHATGGENGPAKAAMERLISYDPGAAFSPNFFSPDLLKFAEATRKAAANGKGELTVKTRPDGARVWVDGAWRGVAPVTVSGLAPGKHWVTAVMGGYGLSQAEVPAGDQTVDLKAIELSPALTKAEDQVSKDPEGSGRDAALVQLGKKLGADQLLVFVGRKSTTGEQVDVTALRLDVRDGHNYAFATGTLRMGDERAAATFADGLLGRDAERQGNNPVTHFRGGLTFTPRKIAAFSLFGFGALALGTGIVFGVQALNNANNFRQTMQVLQVSSANLATAGRTFSIVADISYLLALASVVTGGILFFTGNGPPAESSSSASTGSSSGSSGNSGNSGNSGSSGNSGTSGNSGSSNSGSSGSTGSSGSSGTSGSDDRARDDEKKKADEKKADEKKADEKKSKKERDEEEKRKKDEDKKKAAEDEKRRKEDEKKAAEDEKKRKDDEKKKADEEKKAKAEEEKKAKADDKRSKKERDADEKKKREEEEKAKRAEEEKAQRDAEEKKKKDAEEKKRIEEEKKKADEKKKSGDDHDDLRNY